MGEWYRDAACRGHDVELFYSEEREDTLKALQICGRCPVRDACREAAMDQREFFGVWGGIPGPYRRRLFRREDRQRRRAARAA